MCTTRYGSDITMLAVVKIERWTNRPPNLPSWKVTYKMDNSKDVYVRYPFAVDEAAAYADTVRWLRWKEETFRLSVDQKT